MTDQLDEAESAVRRAWPWLLARLAAITPVLLLAALVAVLAWWLDDEQCLVPGLMDTIKPGGSKDGGTTEVPGRAA